MVTDGGDGYRWGGGGGKHYSIVWKNGQLETVEMEMVKLSYKY